MGIEKVAPRALLLAALGGCAVVPPPPPPPAAEAPCPGGTAPQLLATLYFGRAVAGRADVTEREWRDFVETVVARHLPAGFTAFDARGEIGRAHV